MSINKLKIRELKLVYGGSTSTDQTLEDDLKNELYFDGKTHSLLTINKPLNPRKPKKPIVDV